MQDIGKVLGQKEEQARLLVCIRLRKALLTNYGHVMGAMIPFWHVARVKVKSVYSVIGIVRQG